MLKSSSLDEVRAELAMEIGMASRRWRTLVDEHLRDYGLTHARWQVLQELQNAPLGLNQRELAQRLAIEPASLVGQLDGLEKQGLVERLEAPGDRRAHAIVLTDTSQSLYRRVTAVVDQLRARATAGLRLCELDATIEALRTIRSNLEQL